MLNEFKFDYDPEEDLLYIYDENKKSKGSVEFADLIIDLDKNQNVVALEIFDASRYLSYLTNRRITKKQLKEIEKATLYFSVKKGLILIKFFLPLKKERIPVPIMIQNMHYHSPSLKFVRS